jgi:alginate O-acetyltransferase complex protein AlgI
MTEVNLFVLSSFAFVSILAILFTGKQYGWTALLIVSLVFGFFVFGNNFLLLVLMSGCVYFSALLIAKKPSYLKYAAGIFLLPLLAAKLVHRSSHFNIAENSLVFNDADISWENWLIITGLSYFIFNALSYLIDVKRKYIKEETNFFRLLLYLVYFPAFFSGPLHRYKYLQHQFNGVALLKENISKGGRLFLWGLFKNMVIAQRLFFVLQSMNTVEITGAYMLLQGLVFFLYLYANFSSFIDMVLGISQLFNVQLKGNFHNRVYLSSSRQQFWRGWHITLNEWFKDYFFFSVAKYDKKRIFTNWILMATFLLIALWHGFTLVLLVWGLMNGLWIILEKKSSGFQIKRQSVRTTLGVMYHLFFASILALVFISPDIAKTANNLFIEPAFMPVDFLILQKKNLLILVSGFVIMDFFNAKAGAKRMDNFMGELNGFTRWVVYTILILFVLLFGQTGNIANYYIRF